MTKSKRLKGVHYRSERDRWFAERTFKGYRHRAPLRETQWEAYEDRIAMDRAVREGTFMQLYGPHPIASLEEAVVDYLEWCATGKATPNAPKTIQCKGRHLRTIGELLNKRPDQIVEFDLLKIRKSLRRRMAGPTVNRHMATLSDMMRYLRRHNVILASPCVGIERYQETEQTRTAPNDVDVDSLVASCGAAPLPWMGVLITLLFDTGVRVNEALRARQAASTSHGVRTA